MQSTAGVKHLLQALKSQSSPTYTINSLECHHEDTDCKQQLLTALPQQSIELMETLTLSSKTIQPLPRCLPTLLPTLKKLHTLQLQGATAETLTATLQALTGTSTLKDLNLMRSQFNLEVMQALYSVLFSHSKSIKLLTLQSCKINDAEAQLLTTVLYRLKSLEVLNLYNNDIHDSGLTLAEAILGHTALRFVYLVDNPISASGRAALDKFMETNNIMWLYF